MKGRKINPTIDYIVAFVVLLGVVSIIFFKAAEIKKETSVIDWMNIETRK